MYHEHDTEYTQVSWMKQVCAFSFETVTILHDHPKSKYFVSLITLWDKSRDCSTHSKNAVEVGVRLLISTSSKQKRSCWKNGSQIDNLTIVYGNIWPSSSSSLHIWNQGPIVTWYIGNWELGSKYIGNWKIRVGYLQAKFKVKKEMLAFCFRSQRSILQILTLLVDTNCPTKNWISPDCASGKRPFLRRKLLACGFRDV